MCVLHWPLCNHLICHSTHPLHFLKVFSYVSTNLCFFVSGDSVFLLSVCFKSEKQAHSHLSVFPYLQPHCVLQDLSTTQVTWVGGWVDRWVGIELGLQYQRCPQHHTISESIHCLSGCETACHWLLFLKQSMAKQSTIGFIHILEQYVFWAFGLCTTPHWIKNDTLKTCPKLVLTIQDILPFSYTYVFGWSYIMELNYQYKDSLQST